MGIQVDMEKANAAFQDPKAKEVKKELTEEHFLKDLFLFMNKRDTPIERVPHLGFKQIDLFVMFKTVYSMGGYQQVTAQQLWKQVYNTLGGNPRSTSAATCTRRHYEKLLLPYECHLKGIVLNVLLQPKPVLNPVYRKEHYCGPSQPKRRIVQAYPFHHQIDPRGHLLPPPPPYPHYYHPTPPTLITSTVRTSQPLPVTETHLPYPSPQFRPRDSAQDSLEHLRNLSTWYKTSSGLIQQPLNLSKKTPPQNTPTSSPVSSFSPPSSSKNPKFLNKPSTLYTSQHAEVAKSEESETQDAGTELGIASYSPPPGEKEVDAAGEGVGASTYSRSLTLKGHNDAPTTSCSPKAECPPTALVGGQRYNLQHLLPGLPLHREGKMEFEVPLSVFQSWLKMYGSSALSHKTPLFSPNEEPNRRWRWSDSEETHTNMNSPKSPKDLSPIRPSSYTIPSLLSSTSTNPSRRKVPNTWFDHQEALTTSSSRSAQSQEDVPVQAQTDVRSKLCLEEKSQRSDSSSSSSLRNIQMEFTTEEVMKLKKMLSSSS